MTAQRKVEVRVWSRWIWAWTAVFCTTKLLQRPEGLVGASVPSLEEVKRIILMKVVSGVDTYFGIFHLL